MEHPTLDDHDRFDGWQILGRGGLGETWLANDRLTRRPVVVKLRRADQAKFADRQADNHIVQQNPHLQKQIDVLPQQQGGSALVYEYVDGISLYERLRKEDPLPRDQALSVTCELLAGLVALHADGLVHRDVSPENIILSNRGAVLIDFDAIGALTEDSFFGKTTVVGEFAGKPLYMAPEQIVGAPQSAAVDIWASGAVLFECLTGKTLRTSTNIGDLVREHSAPVDLSAVPGWAQSVLKAMLAPDPVDRPSAAEAMGQIKALIKPPVMQPSAPIPDDWDLSDFDGLLEQPLGARPPPPSPQPVSAASPKTGLWLPLKIAVLFGLSILAVFALYVSGLMVGNLPETIGQTAPATLIAVALVIGGVALAASSFFVARFVKSRAAQSDLAIPFRAMELINAPDARDRLTETICMRIDSYREAAGHDAQDMLTVTMMALAKEYATAETADARFKALGMLNELHGQISSSLRPWWTNYETLIARILSLTTLVAGLVAAVEGVRRLF